MQEMSLSRILITLVLFITAISPLFFFILTLRKAFMVCAQENRMLKPNHVWLVIIPVFGYFWLINIVVKLSRSLEFEFESRNIENDSDFGKKSGLIYLLCLPILNFPVFIMELPFLKILIIILCLTFFILYWIEINKLIKQLSNHSILNIN